MAKARTSDHGKELKSVFREFRLPPANFDLRTATKRELVAYGIPACPDPRTHPRMYAQWQRLADMKPRFVQPKLKTMDGGRRGINLVTAKATAPYSNIVRSYIDRFRDYPVLHHRNPDPSIGWPIATALPETFNTWSGAYLNQPPGMPPLTRVIGQWTGPSAWPPPSAWNGSKYADGKYSVANWVGLDGVDITGGKFGDVLQAGTSSEVQVTGGVVVSQTYYAWTEWYPVLSIPQALQVTPGDTIHCAVCAPIQNDHGTAAFINVTTGETTLYGIDHPPDAFFTKVRLTGNVAEWVSEDPGDASGALLPLAAFGRVDFSECTAGSKDAEYDLWLAQSMDMIDGAGNIRVEGQVLTPSSVRTRFRQ